MERTVGQVQPNLENNASKINSLIGSMDKSLETKAKELADFKEKHGIKVTMLQLIVLSNLYIYRSSRGKAKSGGNTGAHRLGVL